MFDTVTLKIKGLQLHKSLVKNIALSATKIYSRAITKDADQLLVESYNFTKAKKYLQHDLVHLQKSGRIVETFINYSMTATSSHYSVIISVDIVNDCINLAFSVPKYFYGTNVVQMVKHRNDKHFHLSSTSFEQQAKSGYIDFVKYLKAFFEINFVESPVYWHKVQLMRLDLCFNLVFPNVDVNQKLSEAEQSEQRAKQCFDYLAQTAIMKSHGGAEISKRVVTRDGWWERNSDYMFKCYHKGTDFRRVDGLELTKQNRTLHKQQRPLYPVKDMQALADRTLRYELTFFSSYISKIFNRNIRDKSPSFAILKMLFKKIKSIGQKTDIVEDSYNLDKNPFHDILNKNFHNANIFMYEDLIHWVEITMYKGEFLSDYLLNNYSLRGSQNGPYRYMVAFDTFYKEFNSYLDRSHLIYLKHLGQKRYEYEEWLLTNSLKTPGSIVFSSKLLNLMFEKFWKHVKYYELTDMPQLATFKEGIIAYNESVKGSKKSGVNLPLCISIYELMQRRLSLKSIQKKLGLPPATFYRYKKVFEQNGLRYTSTKGLVLPTYNLVRYYDDILRNNYSKIFGESYRF